MVMVPAMETKKVKIRITKHPREKFYEGFSCTEHNVALCQAMTESSEELFLQKHQPAIKEFIDSCLPEDVIGVYDTKYKVYNTGDCLAVEALNGNNEGEIKKFTVNDLDLALGVATKFAEILYRDKKPFGLVLEKEVSLLINKDMTNEGKSIP
jgi:hypothetical protein